MTAAAFTPPAERFHATVGVPGDKSLSHRALLLAAMAEGTSRIVGLADGQDVRSMADAIAFLGVAIEGELWQVDAACLARLDEIEAVDAGLYERRAIQLTEPLTDSDVQSYFFLMNTAGLEDCGVCWQPQSGSTWSGGPPAYP